MADVLEVYAEPDDPRRPKVNVAATNTPLIPAPRLPRPAQPGQPQRWDYEDERHGTRHLFLFVEPQAGERPVQVTEQRTTVDVAHAMQGLVDICAPEAEVMRVVLDHLTTPRIASLYAAVEPAEARRLARQLEWHDTPKQGRWLNRAEIEWRVLQQPCLARRIPDADTLTRAMAAWKHQRHAAQATSDGRLSVTDARKKLERLSPSLPA